MTAKYVSIPMSTGRGLAHGKIDDLTENFSLPGGIPFSVFVKKKTGTDDIIVFPCKCYLDDDASDLPVVVGKWDESAIIDIEADSIDLDAYDVYWAAGAKPKTV